MAKRQKRNGRKNLKVFVRDPDLLNLRFYKSYDDEFLLTKAKALFLAIRCTPEFNKIGAEKVDPSLSFEPRHLQALRADLHFCVFHQFEAMFSLALAIFQSDPHWLFLTQYTTEYLKEAVELLLKGNFRALSGGVVSSGRAFAQYAFYSDFRDSNSSPRREWDVRLDDVLWFLQRIGAQFLRDASYRSYKHGLRLSASESTVRIFETDEPGKTALVSTSECSIAFLEILKRKDAIAEARVTKEHVDYELSFLAIDLMSTLLKNIRQTRLATLTGDTKPVLYLFPELERSDFSRGPAIRRSSFSV